MQHTLTQLNNGLRVILLPIDNINSVTVLVMIKTGSKYENKNNNGISHFIEHMLFKGTKNKPSALQISQTVEGVGGITNAFTSKEYTGYFIKISSDYLDTALNLISDIYQNSLFKNEEIEKERGVIIEEINMYNDLPQKYVGVLFEKLLYGDQPAGWDIAGTKENILNMKRRDLLDYINNQYSSVNTILCIAGNFNNQKINKLIQKYFSKIKNVQIKSAPKTIEKQIKPRTLIHYKETDQAHLILGFRAYNVFDEKKYPLSILSTILGGNMSSRLFQIIREKLGLAYYIGSDAENYTDSGYFKVRAGVNLNKTESAISAILKELNPKELSKNIKEQEIKQAKEYLKGVLSLEMEDSFNTAYFHANQLLILNKILTINDIFKKLDKINKNDIIKIMREIFKADKLNLTVIGPFKNNQPLEKILNSYKY